MARQKRHLHRVYQVIGEPERGARVAGYVRYSSELQDPASIQTQKRKIEEYCERKGWVIVRWYEEPERSAKYEDIAQRPIFAQLIADAGGEFQVVICYMNNRWARNVPVAYTSLSELRHKRVWWATADGQWDIDKVQQSGYDIVFAVDTQMNAGYSRDLSKRTIDGKEDRGRQGYHNGPVSFGYLRPKYPQAPEDAPSTWKPPRMPARVNPETFPALVKLGELAAEGWTDAAIADALTGYVSRTSRYGARALSKDTVAAIRRSWFPREFAPGSGFGTIETPAGELVEGKHPAAWPYAIWQRMVQAKAGQFRRPRTDVETERKPHIFSRIIVCAACRRPLRVAPSKGVAYYKDTSLVRKLPCSAFGCLSVKDSTVVRQFGEVLMSVTLPESWREAVADRSREAGADDSHERVEARRAELEAERKRLVGVFAKGYLDEAELDTHVERIRSELATLPAPTFTRSADARIEAAVEAGETLADMAGYWDEATDEERRDIVWALLQLGGLIYDLEHRVIVGLVPRPDVLPVLALGLGDAWDLRDGGLWLPDEHRASRAERPDARRDGPPFRANVLSPERQEDALELIRAGRSPQQVATKLGVSYWVISRLLKRHMPREVSRQQQPKLSLEQQREALVLLGAGLSLRQVAAQYPGVSYGAIWRLARRHGARKEGGLMG